MFSVQTLFSGAEILHKSGATFGHFEMLCSLWLNHHPQFDTSTWWYIHVHYIQYIQHNHPIHSVSHHIQYMHRPLPWFTSSPQTIEECVLQLEWQWVLYPHVGKWKSFPGWQNWTVVWASWMGHGVWKETLRITWVSLTLMWLAEVHVKQGQHHSWAFDYKSNFPNLDLPMAVCCLIFFSHLYSSL